MTLPVGDAWLAVSLLDLWPGARIPRWGAVVVGLLVTRPLLPFVLAGVLIVALIVPLVMAMRAPVPSSATPAAATTTNDCPVTVAAGAPRDLWRYGVKRERQEGNQTP
jgi:hypothetical protein